MVDIKTDKLTKKYQNLTAVDSLELSIEHGELFSLLGVNGAGKSTTIKMLTCLSKPTSGNAFILGESILTNPFFVKDNIGVSPQETAVAANLTVKENLEFIAGIHGSSNGLSKEKAVQMIKKFHFAKYENIRSKNLSGGWQRRLSIAMALISEPKILFLDEPTLGLDVLARRELWEVIRDLKTSTTIILTTHYLEEAQALSDRIGIMSSGKLTAAGTVEEIIKKSGKNNFEDAFITLAGEEDYQ